MTKYNFANTVVQALDNSIPFVSFDELEEQRKSKFINLGNNISTYDLPADLIEQFGLQLNGLVHNYGDPTSFILRQSLSEILPYKYEEILLSAGIDSLLCLVARTFLEKDQSVLLTKGTYPTFAYFAKSQGAQLHYATYQDDYQINLDQLQNMAHEIQPRLLYIANPDNPTGQVISPEKLQEFLTSLPDKTLAVIDEAYYDFLIPDLKQESKFDSENVLRLRTFSKGYGLAGMRIGFCLGDASLLNELNKIRIQFDVNRPGQWMANEMLKRTDWLASHCAEIDQLLTHLQSSVSDLDIQPLETSTNFVCLDFGSKERAEYVQSQLLNTYSIFTRKPNVEPLQSLIRVSVGRPNEISFLIDSLRKI